MILTQVIASLKLKCAEKAWVYFASAI